MLKGKHVILRPLRLEDREYTIRWRNDLFIKSSTMSHPFPVPEEMERKWYEQITGSKDNSYIPYTVVTADDKEKVIGFFSLNNINWVSRIGFISGMIGERENIGRGMGREALELLIKYAFDFLNLGKISAYVRTDHPAMKTWIETGAVKEGILKKHYYADGKYYDVNILSWFRDDGEDKL